MQFISTLKFDSNAEEILWERLKEAFDSPDVPGFCWHRYPIVNRHGLVIQPDFVVLHPFWGLKIIEVKGCRIDNIEAIEGDTWYMADWYSETMEPFEQGKKHMWAILDRLRDFKGGALRTADGRSKIVGDVVVALPQISADEWIARGFENHPSVSQARLILSDDMTREGLTMRLATMPYSQENITSDDFQIATAVLTGSEALQRTPRRPAKNPNSRAAKLRQVEERMVAFDMEQHRVAVSVPSGPQRIRGLAGTGKTVVLAMKAAYMHVTEPDWDIAVTFYSRSLYSQIRQLVERFVSHFSSGSQTSPNWSKVRVMHGWGTASRDGMYSVVCRSVARAPRTYNEALRFFGTTSGKLALSRSCEELLHDDIPGRFDAILIDESQDFGEGFFRMCYAALKEPKRLVWAYDEVQSLSDLAIPTAESLFGTNDQGEPLVDLSGTYPGDIEKDLVLYHCYRNPRPILIAAHAFGLGLLRPEGALQFIDTSDGWRDIGYEFAEPVGEKLETGAQVTLLRSKANSPHLLEDLTAYRELVSWMKFPSREEELAWVANDIATNIRKEELQPHEVVVISLEPMKAHTDFSQLRSLLKTYGINASEAGEDTNADVFRVDDHVTLAHIYRAKGNEASVVYVIGFETIWRRRNDHYAITARNRAFTAMSRAKGWLVLTGVGEGAERLFNEVEQIMEQVGKVTFTVPDIAQIQRNLETSENQRRRKRTQKAKKTAEQLLDDLRDVDIGDLPEAVKDQLLNALLTKRGQRQ